MRSFFDAQKLGIAQKGLILISVPLAFELAFLGVIGGVLAHSQRDLDRVSQSREVIARADEVGRLMMQSSALAAVNTFSSSDELKARFKSVTRSIMSEYDGLESLLAQKPDDLANLRKLRAQTTDVLSALDNFQNESSPGTVQGVLGDERAKKIKYQSHHIGVALLSLVSEEQQLAGQSAAMREKLGEKLKFTLLVGLLSSAVVTIGMALYFGRNIARRLKRVNENSAKLAARAPLLEPLAGSDEIAELDKAFHQADHSLRQLERVKRGLTLAIADHMQGPLEKVGDTTREFLANSFGELNEKTRDRMERTAESNQRLLRLVNDLRTMDNASEPGQFELDLQSIDLSSIVNSAVSSMRDLASERNLILDLNLIEHQPIAGDRDRLIQVVVNLISNAIKFSPPSGKININSRSVPGAITFIELSVSDEGPGIKAEYQEKIFALFEQVDAKDATEKGGSGLGLPICRDIVAKHGGTLLVDSSPGHGSTFIVRLPVSVPEISENILHAPKEAT